MIFLSTAEGTITAAVAQPLYQGASYANEVVLIGPFPDSSVVTVSFKLPNGQILKPRLANNEDGDFNMVALSDFSNKFFDKDGKGYNAWRLELNAAVTAIPGVLTIQFLITLGSVGENTPIILPTNAVNMNIGAGVPYIPVNSNEIVDWPQITAALAYINGLDLVPKVGTPNIVYVNNGDGEPFVIGYSEGADASTFPLRNANSQIAAPNQSQSPPGEDEYISKRYGDGNYVKLAPTEETSVYGETQDGEPIMLPLDKPSVEDGENKPTIATKDQRGLIYLPNLPQFDTDSANKRYVNETTEKAKNELNSLITRVYQYGGSVDNFEDLPINNIKIGTVYCVKNASIVDGVEYPPGTNFAWNGNSWGQVGGSLIIFDYVINDLSDFNTAHLANMYGRVLVTGLKNGNENIISVTLPQTITHIEFINCELKINISATHSAKTSISGLVCPEKSTISFFDDVSHCRGDIELIDCTKIVNCTVSKLTRCEHVSNISRYDPDVAIIYDKCRFVDGFSCDDLYDTLYEKTENGEWIGPFKVLGADPTGEVCWHEVLTWLQHGKEWPALQQQKSQANASYAIAFCRGTANAQSSVAIGPDAVADAIYSMALGPNAKANSPASVAIGNGTETAAPTDSTPNREQYVLGRYNRVLGGADVNGRGGAAVILGNGDYYSRKNGVTVWSDGTIELGNTANNTGQSSGSGVIVTPNGRLTISQDPFSPMDVVPYHLYEDLLRRVEALES